MHTAQYTVDGRLGMSCKETQKASTSDQFSRVSVGVWQCQETQLHIELTWCIFLKQLQKRIEVSELDFDTRGSPKITQQCIICLSLCSASVVQIPNTFEINQLTTNQMTGSCFCDLKGAT